MKRSRQTAYTLLTALAFTIVLGDESRSQGGTENLFIDLGADALYPSEAGSLVAERRAVGMRLDRLFTVASSAGAQLTLNVGPQRWIAKFARLDSDATGFRSWVGTLEGVDYSHVVFSERDGAVSGLIDAVSTIYQIRTVQVGQYLLERLDKSRFRPELEPVPGSEELNPVSFPRDGPQDDGSIIDVLMLYTPAARTLAGGASQIQAVASQTVSDGNTIFARSNVAPRLRLVGTTELAFVEASTMSSDLNALRNSSTARSLRNATGADVVQLLVNSPDMSACGIGALLTSLVSSFEAYSISDLTCVGQYTPTHELGHNMGSHHAPEDGAAGALFPYSYGFKDPSRGFRTVMAYACSGVSCPRIANFSNPAVGHNGGPTGTSAQNNALSVNNAAFTVANWRQAVPSQQPGPPTVTSAVAAGGNLTVVWTSGVGGAPTSHSLAFYFGGTLVATVPSGAGTTATIPIPPGVVGTFQVRVTAINAAGSSPPSALFTFTIGGGAPGQPTVTSAVATGGVLNVAWTSGAGVAPTTHRLDFYAGGTLVAQVGVGAATTTAIPIPPGITGAFGVRVTAFNGAMAGPPSAEFAFTIGSVCTLPAAPIVSGGVVNGIASVSWQPVAGAASYVVSAGTSPGGTQYLAPTNVGGALSVGASGLPPGFFAWARVIAVNACNQAGPHTDFLVQ